jgi:hypothetical protein
MKHEVMNMNFDVSSFTKQLPPPNNIHVLQTRVKNEVVITWDKLHLALVDVKYHVYRGTANNGVFYRITKEPISDNSFIDVQEKHPALYNQYWYKVSSVCNDIEGRRSLPVQYQPTTQNRWFKKINERNLWLLKNTGVICDLYTRKWEGEHCPDCYDELRGRASNSMCPKCFGTGFVNGYEPQFALYVRLGNSESTVSQNIEGLESQNSISCWTITPTRIRNFDMLFTPDGSILEVTSSYINSADNYNFHQEFKARYLEPNDPKYNIRRATLKLCY